MTTGQPEAPNTPIPKENSLNPHSIWAVWSEDGTEVLEFCFCKIEAQRAVPDDKVCHVAEYTLKKSWIEGNENDASEL